MKNNLLIKIIFLFSLIFFFPRTAYGVDFNLFGPTEVLQRGQTVVFRIEIDTQNQTLNSTQIKSNYETKYLEYLNTTPGDTFSTITADPSENGLLLITGTSSSGFSGQGTFAYLNFKLIAEAPGSTQLCSLQATTQPPPSNPTSPPQPTNPPQPTTLPKSGSTQKTTTALLVGTAFILGAISIFVFKNHYLPIPQFKKHQNKISTNQKHHQKQ